MADVWRGDILLSDGTVIPQITLASPNVASTALLSSATLRFLSVVDTARIPLYLSAGPSLDVWTTSKVAEQWFHSRLLSKALENSPIEDSRQEWWTCARSQSPIGILTQVEGDCKLLNGPNITEILFYGTIAAPVDGFLPTPPSSSPDLSDVRNERLPELRVHALPISSELIHKSILPIFPPLPPCANASESPLVHEPQFLSPQFRPERIRTRSPKRKQDIFDEAKQLQKKARRKGGESVAAAAAKAKDAPPTFTHRKSLSIDTRATPLPDIRPASANDILSHPSSRMLSRSPSMTFDVRPTSRKGLVDGQGKRSTLSRVATVPLRPEEPTIETRNKEALSRVVMSAMRMHGLQQRKKTRSRRGSVAPGVEATDQVDAETVVEEAAKDEEYKLIYHQTYKGAALALRKHISTKPLHTQPDLLRDVVEKLLTIFCTNPLTETLTTTKSNLLATPGSGKRIGMPESKHSQDSPFDAPSRSIAAPTKLVEDSLFHMGSPVMKRKGKAEQSIAV
ncbi:hypothetical protein CC78DRAFT_566069 [Lojkania enalia]|uniref:Sld7 C-terminal domain-containing protein n=1 Tax=Lojkania enalia TaxID=147567 RepID=A0A9P4KEA0_9PLEO|nr:hypothetical protein CC78DRAFT_566069 [Didymosphaeria enalia]